MLSLARNIPAAVQATRSGDWPRTQGISLKGKTVGLIGFGSIGKHVARMLGGFGCTLLAYDPVADEATAAVLNVQLVEQDEVAGRADILSLHCPMLPETRGMVDAGFLARMKPGSFLVNTARGELVNESALLAALESGHATRCRPGCVRPPAAGPGKPSPEPPARDRHSTYGCTHRRRDECDGLDGAQRLPGSATRRRPALPGGVDR